MMEALCQNYIKELEIINEEIEKLYADNNSLISDTTFGDKELALEKYLEGLVTFYPKFWEYLYYRDRLAYETNTAYK